MLLSKFLKEYSSRKNERSAFRTICKENGISYKKLTPLLKDLGFEYDKSSFDWIWTKQDQAPDLDLAEKVPMRAPVQQKHSASDTEEVQAQIAAAAEEAQQQQEYAASKKQAADLPAAKQPHIISDQLFDIVDLLQQINEKIPARKESAAAIDQIEEDPEAAPLALQLHRINQSAKARKTINISEEAASWLDSFSDTKGYKIGDLVTLAILKLKKQLD